MELPRRRFLQLAVTAAVIPAAADLAEAQSWPNRVVRVVVGLPAGGGADAVARILANRLSEIFGQQVSLASLPIGCRRFGASKSLSKTEAALRERLPMMRSRMRRPTATRSYWPRALLS